MDSGELHCTAEPGAARSHAFTFRGTVIIFSPIEALFSSPGKPKTFQNFPLYRILRHIHVALNIDENKN
jgi:hypothetical protein